MKKYFVYQDEKSHKFWEINVKGKSHTIRFGKVDARGQSSTKEFDSKDEALQDAKKRIKSKVASGYVEGKVRAAKVTKATGKSSKNIDYRERLKSIQKVLKQHPEVKIIEFRINKPATPAALKACKDANFPTDMLSFFEQVNGFSIEYSLNGNPHELSINSLSDIYFDDIESICGDFDIDWPDDLWDEKRDLKYFERVRLLSNTDYSPESQAILYPIPRKKSEQLSVNFFNIDTGLAFYYTGMKFLDYVDILLYTMGFLTTIPPFEAEDEYKELEEYFPGHFSYETYLRKIKSLKLIKR